MVKEDFASIKEAPAYLYAFFTHSHDCKPDGKFLFFFPETIRCLTAAVLFTRRIFGLTIVLTEDKEYTKKHNPTLCTKFPSYSHISYNRIIYERVGSKIICSFEIESHVSFHSQKKYLRQLIHQLQFHSVFFYHLGNFPEDFIENAAC